MHAIQRKLLEVIDQGINIAEMSFREIGLKVGDSHPEKIRHHVMQLQKRGLIKLNRDQGMVYRIKKGAVKHTNLLAIPILGMADCGPQTMVAEENIEGYLRVSRKLLNRKNIKHIFAIKAVGDSMNEASINGKKLESGDYAIIDGSERAPRNGEYVLSIIDGLANIKRYFEDKENSQIVLMSESSKDLTPIYIHPEDDDFIISGTVVQVIKRPKIK